MEKIKVDLDVYVKEGSKFLMGRTEGEVVRDEICLDELLKKYKRTKDVKLVFSLNKDIYSIGATFTLGLFSDVIGQLGSMEEVNNFIDLSNIESDLRHQILCVFSYVLETKRK